MGEYLHFGYGTITPIDTKFRDSMEIAFCGQNEVDDPDSISHAVLIILDPSKIIGKIEAGDSHGFGLPVSRAEKYIIRFPLSDMNYALKSNAHVADVILSTVNGKKVLQVSVLGGYQPQGSKK